MAGTGLSCQLQGCSFLLRALKPCTQSSACATTDFDSQHGSGYRLVVRGAVVWEKGPQKIAASFIR